MNTKPDYIADVPAGDVYLGRGGTFVLPPGVAAAEMRCITEHRYPNRERNRETKWSSLIRITGSAPFFHYCAPRGSAVVVANEKRIPLMCGFGINGTPQY